MSAAESSIPERVETKKCDGVTRRSRWASSWEAIKLTIASFNQEGDKIRKSDKATSALLVLIVLGSTGFILFPDLRDMLLLAANITCSIVITFYLANRLGILTQLEPRQRLIVAELMIGIAAISVLIFLNAVALRDIFVKVLLSI